MPVPVNEIEENNSISVEDLPLLWPTFGPLGGEQHPSNSSFEQGIHIEECTTIVQIKEDGQVRGCGSVVILMQESSGCFIESELSIEYVDTPLLNQLSYRLFSIVLHQQ